MKMKKMIAIEYTPLVTPILAESRSKRRRECEKELVELAVRGFVPCTTPSTQQNLDLGPLKNQSAGHETCKWFEESAETNSHLYLNRSSTNCEEANLNPNEKLDQFPASRDILGRDAVE